MAYQRYHPSAPSGSRALDDWQALSREIEDLGWHPVPVRQGPPAMELPARADTPQASPRRPPGLHDINDPRRVHESRAEATGRALQHARDVALAEPSAPRSSNPGMERRRPAEDRSGAVIYEVRGDDARDKRRDVTSSAPGPQKLTIKLPPAQVDARGRYTVHIIPDLQHSTIWDGSEKCVVSCMCLFCKRCSWSDLWYRSIFAWSGVLVVRDYQPPSHFYTRDIIRDFSILFQTSVGPRGDAVSSPSVSRSPPPLPHRQDSDWEVEYSGKRISRAPMDYRSAERLTGNLPLDRGIAIENDVQFVEPQNEDGPYAWRVRFWVPVPVSLFARAEHKTFLCRAKVIVEDSNGQKSKVSATSVPVGIERLRSPHLSLQGGYAT
ncbi:hypothetical protein C8Q79DRAFT_332009 [Trametes meyenii]|nr:hypothetical protein C8Q79DRAFT_332009 [Trametes meyenii]